VTGKVRRRPRERGNVCAIRRKSDGYWWECNSEHGAGWSDKRIRQAWTLREARNEVIAMYQRGVDVADVEVVELVPAWTLEEA